MKITRKNIFFFGEEPKPVRIDLTVITEILTFIFLSVILFFFIFKIFSIIEFDLKSGDKGSILLSAIIFLLISPASVHFIAKLIGHFLSYFFKNHEIS